MKKNLKSLVLASAVMAFFACKNEPSSSNTASAPSSTPEQSQALVASTSTAEYLLPLRLQQVQQL